MDPDDLLLGNVTNNFLGLDWRVDNVSIAYLGSSIDLECFLTEPIHDRSAFEECNKATQHSITVREDLGTRVMHVPATAAALQAAVDREQWMSADTTARDVVVNTPGNRLGRLADAIAGDAIIYNSVVQRRIKVHQSTGRLVKRKSRLCADSSKSSRGGKKARAAAPRPFYAPMSDELTGNLFFSDAADRNRELSQGDIADAYPMGVRKGELPFS